MASSQLPNYLRANRKRVALSQRDVAFLLGCQSPAKMSRHENYARVPSLETALACEVIFKRSVSELFGGLYQRIEREVAERAKVPAKRNHTGKAGRLVAKKRKILAELANV